MKPDVRDDNLRQLLELLDLTSTDAPRPRIDHAERPQTDSILEDQRRSGIEAQMRRVLDQRVPAKPLVLRKVADDEHLIGLNDLCAETDFPRHLCCIEAAIGLEPDASLADERHEGDRYVEERFRGAADGIEVGLCGGIDDPKVMERVKPCVFIAGHCYHRSDRWRLGHRSGSM